MMLMGTFAGLYAMGKVAAYTNPEAHRPFVRWC